MAHLVFKNLGGGVTPASKKAWKALGGVFHSVAEVQRREHVAAATAVAICLFRQIEALGMPYPHKIPYVHDDADHHAIVHTYYSDEHGLPYHVFYETETAQYCLEV